MDKLVRVRALVPLLSTHHAFNDKQAGQEFDAPWLLSKQMEDMGKVVIIKDLNAQEQAAEPAVSPSPAVVSRASSSPVVPASTPATSPARKKPTPRAT